MEIRQINMTADNVPQAKNKTLNQKNTETESDI